jgi:hypothetical protein
MTRFGLSLSLVPVESEKVLGALNPRLGVLESTLCLCQ